MGFRGLILLCCGVFCLSAAQGQRTYNTIAQDTIITKSGFITDVYLLDGKRLNLQVMQFFMADHPLARSHIRGAILTDQLGVAGYTIGGLFVLTGALLNQSNPSASRDLFFYGGIGIGTALFFQIISNNYRKNAVRTYNEDIKAYYRDKGMGVFLGPSAEGVGVKIGF